VGVIALHPDIDQRIRSPCQHSPSHKGGRFDHMQAGGSDGRANEGNPAESVRRLCLELDSTSTEIPRDVDIQVLAIAQIAKGFAGPISSLCGKDLRHDDIILWRGALVWCGLG